MRYELICYKFGIAKPFKIYVEINLDEFEEQISKGYVDYIDEENGTRTIIYLNNYDKVEIYEM